MSPAAKSKTNVRRALSVAWSAVGGLLVLLVLIEALLQVRLARVQRKSRERWIEAGVRGEAAAPWARDYFEEVLAMQFLVDAEDFVLWRQRPYQGRNVHIDADGMRHTPQPAGELPEVWVFGGSTTWGWGQRDDRTIPAQIAKRLGELGVAARVRNAGQIAYFSTQELALFLRLLQTTEHPPRFAVFIDGINEALTAFDNGGVVGQAVGASVRHRLLWGPSLFEALRLTGQRTATYRFLQRQRRGPGAPLDEATAQAIVRTYLTNQRAARALAEASHVQPLFYWQPTLAHKRRWTPLEDETSRWPDSGVFELSPLLERTSVLVAQALAEDPTFHDLEGLFADRAETIYPDSIHYTEAAAAEIGERIARDLAGAMANPPPRR